MLTTKERRTQRENRRAEQNARRPAAAAAIVDALKEAGADAVFESPARAVIRQSFTVASVTISNNKLRAQIRAGRGGTSKGYPQRKDGTLNIAAIVTTMLENVKGEQAGHRQRERAAEATARTAEVLERAGLPRRFAQARRYGPAARAQVNFLVDADSEAGVAFLTALAEVVEKYEAAII